MGECSRSKHVYVCPYCGEPLKYSDCIKPDARGACKSCASMYHKYQRLKRAAVCRPCDKVSQQLYEIVELYKQRKAKGLRVPKDI